MRITSDGRLGLGTTTPSTKLEVAGNLLITGANIFTDATSGIFFSGANNNFTNGIGGVGTNNIFIQTASAERMRIDSSGVLMINTTNTNPAGGNTASGASFRAGGQLSSSQSADNVLLINRGNDGTIVSILRGGASVGSISVTASATAFNTASDYRLKENVNYDFDATTRLKQLKPARFNFIADTNKTVDGFLAHEVQSVIPEAIVGTKDDVEDIGNITDSEDNIIQENVTEPNELPENQTWTQTGTRPVYQGIDQAKLTPILTKALQEAIAKIEQLETRLTALENN